jgi:5-methylcytosine-specific restriction endonuclease McrA
MTRLDVEHIIPKSQGGLTELSNLALSCHGCNLAKSDKTNAEDAVSGTLVRLFHPRRDVWHEHFLWANNFTLSSGALRRAALPSKPCK